MNNPYTTPSETLDLAAIARWNAGVSAAKAEYYASQPCDHHRSDRHRLCGRCRKESKK